MCSRTLRTPGGNARAWVIYSFVVVSAILATSASAAVVPVDVTVDQFDLGASDESFQSAIDVNLSPLTLDPAEAHATPSVVPLPPALGTGLFGLAAMAVLRVGRRVYRRR